MDKKDIYEHLAKIYLDASSKKKKKNKHHQKVLRHPFFIFAVVFLLGFGVFSFLNFKKGRHFSSQVALVVSPDALKINFNFNPAKKEIYSLDLNKLNLTKFKALGFSVKKADFKDNISLKVEFINKFNERSEIYLKNIPHKWYNYKIDFSEFKNISDWREMSTLAFAVEEWNARKNSGVVYIDNIRFLR